MNADVKLEIFLEHLDIRCKYYSRDFDECNRLDADSNKCVNCRGEINECELTKEELE